MDHRALGRPSPRVRNRDGKPAALVSNNHQETVAEHTQKPLFPINVGELTMESGFSLRLQSVFLRASRWDAVLLMDEADVVLEKRSFENLTRNGVVSGKFFPYQMDSY